MTLKVHYYGRTYGTGEPPDSYSMRITEGRGGRSIRIDFRFTRSADGLGVESEALVQGGSLSLSRDAAQKLAAAILALSDATHPDSQREITIDVSDG